MPMFIYIALFLEVWADPAAFGGSLGQKWLQELPQGAEHFL